MYMSIAMRFAGERLAAGEPTLLMPEFTVAARL